MDDIPNLFLLRAKQQLHIFGFWYPPRSCRLLYRTLTLASFSLIYSLTLFHLVFIVQVWGDLDAVSEAIYLFFTQASVSFKMTSFFARMDDMRELCDFMEIDVFKAKNDRHEKLLVAQAQRIKRVCVFFLALVCSTCSLWAARPFLDGSDRFTLPFRIWMPLDTARSPHFELACVYQNVAVFASGLLFNGIDNVPLAMIMFACGQLQIIKDKLLHMTEMINDAGRRSGNERDGLYQELSSCIHHHQTLIRFVARVEAVYHSNIFFHVCGSVGIICIIGLRISIVEVRSVQFFSTISFLLAMLLQLYSYCWCGHNLTTTSEALLDAAYACSWYRQGRAFRRSLCIALARMRTPLVFRAGGHVVLSFATFLTILRSSYSYFAVLEQVRDK